MLKHKDRIRKEEKEFKICIALLVFAVFVQIVFCYSEAEALETYSFYYAKEKEDNALRYTEHFLGHYKNRFEKAKVYHGYINKYSRQYDIDPLIVAIKISRESSFRYEVKGGIGEVGLMQVVPNGVCARGHDLSTPQGQIKAGIACLAMSRDKCNGSMQQTLTMYASGRCVSKSKHTKWLVNNRIKIYQKWSTK